MKHIIENALPLEKSKQGSYKYYWRKNEFKYYEFL